MKTALIIILSVLLGLMTWVAWHNSVPICDDLVRYPMDKGNQLVCEYSLGDIPADKANVRIRKVE